MHVQTEEAAARWDVVWFGFDGQSDGGSGGGAGGGGVCGGGGGGGAEDEEQRELEESGEGVEGG